MGEVSSTLDALSSGVTASPTMLNPFNMIVMVGLMGLLPFFLTLVTAYIKVIVVTYLVRNALGVQQVPPTMVLTGLALILSAFVMAPVAVSTYHLLQTKALPPDMSIMDLLQLAGSLTDPLRDFLQANSDNAVTRALLNTATNIWPKEIHNLIDQDSLIFVIPSFVITELTESFQIGFLLYLPFIAIDLIISNILLAMGMMMVSPMTISLPFKLLLFVTLEGWLKLCQGLLYSYTYV